MKGGHRGMSTDDVWAVKQASAGPGNRRQEALPDAAAPRPDSPNRAAWRVAAGLFILASAALAAVQFTQVTGFGPRREPYYDYLGRDAYEAVRGLALLVCGALLMVRRTRVPACGLALGITGVWLARYFFVLRPSSLKAFDGLGATLTVGAFAGAVAGALVVLVLLVRTERPGTGPRRAGTGRIVAAAAGLSGAVLLPISYLLPWERFEAGTVSGG
jgi:hypothetical protein